VPIENLTNKKNDNGTKINVVLQPSITKPQNKIIITSLNFFTSILFATNTNEKTLKHDYFNNINIAYRFTIFQLDT
jgi:hypothetical protein